MSLKVVLSLAEIYSKLNKMSAKVQFTDDFFSKWKLSQEISNFVILTNTLTYIVYMITILWIFIPQFWNNSAR